MPTMVEPRQMAKRPGRPKTSERDDVSVKLDRKVVARAKLIATDRGIALAELLTELVRGPIDKAYGQLVRKLGPDGDES